MKRRHELLALIGVRIGKPPGWERVVRWFCTPETFAGSPEVCLVRDGIAFRTRPALPLGWHVLFFGSYEPELREILRVVLRPGAIAIDAGANAGWHTLLMAKLVGEGGRVYAAEPNAAMRAELESNVALNGFANVTLWPYALGDREGELPFHAPPADSPASGDGHVLAPQDAAFATATRVPARSLDALVAHEGIKRLDFLKVDVEGYEWPLLRGAASAIASFRPHIVFEFDSAYAARGGASAGALHDFFRSHGYRLFAIGRTASRELASAPGWPRSADIWAIPEGVRPRRPVLDSPR